MSSAFGMQWRTVYQHWQHWQTYIAQPVTSVDVERSWAALSLLRHSLAGYSDVRKPTKTSFVHL